MKEILRGLRFTVDRPLVNESRRRKRGKKDTLRSFFNHSHSWQPFIYPALFWEETHRHLNKPRINSGIESTNGIHQNIYLELSIQYPEKTADKRPSSISRVNRLRLILLAFASAIEFGFKIPYGKNQLKAREKECMFPTKTVLRLLPTHQWTRSGPILPQRLTTIFFQFGTIEGEWGLRPASIRN